jgi:hypothetical protein
MCCVLFELCVVLCNMYSHTCYMPCPYHSPWFFLLIISGESVHQAAHHALFSILLFVALRSKYSLQHSVPKYTEVRTIKRTWIRRKDAVNRPCSYISPARRTQNIVRTASWRLRKARTLCSRIKIIPYTARHDHVSPPLPAPPERLTLCINSN